MSQIAHPAWPKQGAKSALVFGMSGLGKTRIASILRDSGDWFHYSVDYRIGTRYMGEHIADNFKREAMRVPLLRELLLSDSVTIQSNITFENLAPLSTYLGKPGNPELGGLTFTEYMKRQDEHRTAEIAALLDTRHFKTRAQDLYMYENFICDTGGSICEVVDPDDANDPLLNALSQDHIMVWIEGSDEHTAELIRRFDKAPKPMYYQPQFLEEAWETYLEKTGLAEASVDPNAFVRWIFARALAHRKPRYAAMARNWGVTVSAQDVAKVQTADDFNRLIAAALGKSR